MPVRALRSTTTLRSGSVLGACALLIALAASPATAFAEPELAQRHPHPPCPNSSAPPPPVDTSEVPPPGVPPPEPLPVPEKPIGGADMGGCGLVLPGGAPPPPGDALPATWVLADLDTGKVLAGTNPHGRHRPASVIKVLTALVAMRELNLDQPIVATQADADQEGSKVGLAPGVTYSVRHVLAGLIMQSGNDAAHALAVKLGGVEATVAKMNALAKHLGALDTRAATPSGLDGPGMTTSAYDMALIFRAAMQEPDFVTIASTKHTFLPGNPPLEVWSDNRILLNYPGALGGKTGFTDDARHTYIGAAERDGRKLVAVLLRGENKPIHLSEQTERLLDYGFALPRDASVGELVSEGTPPTSAKVPAPTPETRAATRRDVGTAMFGTVGWPLTIGATAAVLVLGMLGLRRRRASLAVAKRRAAEQADDGPPAA